MTTQLFQSPHKVHKRQPSYLAFYLAVNFLISFGSVTTSAGQPVPDFDCLPNTFYGAVGNTVHEIQWTGGVMQDMGVVASFPFSSFHSLAYGYDITNGSTNRTFYSSTSTFLNPCAVLRFNGSAWDTIATDSLTFHNAGGYGRFIYFQHVGGSADECIKRLNPNGTLTEIFNDSASLSFTVADIAVDTMGNIYCFRGPSIGNTTELTVIDSSGNILNSFSTNLNFLTGLYGAMFFNGTLYVGFTGQQMYPIVLAGTTATLGTPVPTPGSAIMKDLANCHDLIPTGLSHPGSSALQVHHDSYGQSLEIFNGYSGAGPVRVFDIRGKQVLGDVAVTGQNSFNTSNWAGGVYVVVVGGTEWLYRTKIAITRPGNH